MLDRIFEISSSSGVSPSGSVGGVGEESAESSVIGFLGFRVDLEPTLAQRMVLRFRIS